MKESLALLQLRGKHSLEWPRKRAHKSLIQAGMLVYSPFFQPD